MFFQVKIYGYFDLLFPYLFCKMAYEKIIEFVWLIHQRRCYFSKCVRICLISLGTHDFNPICIFHQSSKCSKSARSTDVAFPSPYYFTNSALTSKFNKNCIYYNLATFCFLPNFFTSHYILPSVNCILAHQL